MKKTHRTRHPKQCPAGHQYLSWTMGDEKVFCWICRKEYLLGECLDSEMKDPFDTDGSEQLGDEGDEFPEL